MYYISIAQDTQPISCTSSNDRMVMKKWIEEDMEGNDRWLIYGTIPEFVGRNWRKPQKFPGICLKELIFRGIPQFLQGNA